MCVIKCDSVNTHKTLHFASCEQPLCCQGTRGLLPLTWGEKLHFSRYIAYYYGGNLRARACMCVVSSCRLVILPGEWHSPVLTTVKLYEVAQLVEALRYKSEGRGFESFRSHYGPGVDWASNRNEYQEYFLGGKGGRCVRLTTFPPSCGDCLKIWEPQPPGSLRVFNRSVQGLVVFFVCLGMLWDTWVMCVMFGSLQEEIKSI